MLQYLHSDLRHLSLGCCEVEHNLRSYMKVNQPFIVFIHQTAQFRGVGVLVIGFKTQPSEKL